MPKSESLGKFIIQEGENNVFRISGSAGQSLDVPIGADEARGGLQFYSSNNAHQRAQDGFLGVALP
jgi:hypothetical protein